MRIVYGNDCTQDDAMGFIYRLQRVLVASGHAMPSCIYLDRAESLQVALFWNYSSGDHPNLDFAEPQTINMFGIEVRTEALAQNLKGRCSTPRIEPRMS